MLLPVSGGPPISESGAGGNAYCPIHVAQDGIVRVRKKEYNALEQLYYK